MKSINKKANSEKVSQFMKRILLSAGRRDRYFAAGGGPWDYAAPSLILKEAGCIVTRVGGEEWNNGDIEILASNKYLHTQVRGILNNEKHYMH